MISGSDLILFVAYCSVTFPDARVSFEGFLTTKGELVRSILFPKPVDFRFTQDAFKFVAILAGFALVGMIYTLVLMVGIRCNYIKVPCAFYLLIYSTRKSYFN